ncbi:MAG TPA: ferritin family protein [candidate division Zixibacteria bacterium]|nr:ferritin family protein [candidate division Zixibacteria bacterium]
MDSKTELANLLKTAIKGEEDGYMFYDLLSRKSDNADARRKLENLRDDELGHKETLIEIYKNKIGGEIGELPEKGLTALAEVFRKGHLEDLKNEREFINLAIEAELAATKFYEEQAKSAVFDEHKDVLLRMANEEHRHYELLMAEREAISGNYYWFGFDNSAPLED